ncbi:antibiotic biosynthesis monooxygenase [Enterococcus silesiacus]|uniref:Antibiotic biosynthesis monooxygenase n=1 Tax=Enterococcus silesiacus TaxID=332949 RepID=A0A0S3KG31_9ENTE|nr:antibiotic biosynthesis monooxygenase family protein [Enterococcus silesiacus]ALS03218.1 antibiotic biosynthesis monooxygenase [Enterococcus silesiacus]OJG89370.1 hypothetical protein RV15_GL001677 [Enterococcus silesiacus]
MIVQTVTFSIKKEGKEMFEAKTTKDVASMLEFSGCISSECWYTEDKDTCEFMLVSKWESKKDFQNWLKRPEHLQEHREAHKNKEAKPSFVLEKSRKSYEVHA